MAPQKNKAPTPELVDVLIVGGGPAGLTAAVTVARNVHTAIVFDSQSYRNERADHFHMLPSWDGKDPAAFRDAARANTLENYETIFYEDVTVEKARRDAEGLFELTDGVGRVWKGRGLILATGIIDVPVDIPGFEECWARSIFHCLFCHGYEQRNSPSAGVLAIDDLAPVPFALTVARNAAQLARSVTIYTNGNPAQAAAVRAAIGPDAPMAVDDRRITRLLPGSSSGGGGLTVHLEDGGARDEAFLSHKPRSRLKSGYLAEQLGLELTPQGDIRADPPFGETSLGGCFVAGDNGSFVKTTPYAVNSGANSAAGVCSHVQSRLYGQQSLSESLKQRPG